MKYYISSRNILIDRYQKLSLRSNINFKNDELLFDDLSYAIKYSYYFNNNKITVKLQKQDLKRLNQLRFLILNAPDCEFTYPIDKRGEILFKPIVYFYRLINSVRKQKEILYNVVETKFDNELIYILDDVVINDSTSNLESNTTHYWKNKDDILVNYKLEKINKKIYYDDGLNENEEYIEDYDYIMNKEMELIKINFIPRVYVYNIVINADYSYMDIMYQNYMHLRYKPEIISNQEIEVFNNEDDSKYYSKIAYEYKENFKRIKWKTTNNIKFSFLYQEKLMRTHGTRKVYNNLIVNGNRIKVYTNSLSIYQIDLDKNLLPLEKEYLNIQKQKKQEKIYLFQDRKESADDNAEALYRYYQKMNLNIICYFVLDKSSKDYSRLAAEGFNLVDFGSEKHKKIYLQCDKLISSHAARRIYDPFYPNNMHQHFEKFKFVFLQHGIIMGEHNGFLDYINNDIDLFISSTKEEQELIENFSGLDCVVNTGLARYDNYQTKQKGNYVLYAPSWNTLYRENLQESKYVKEIEKVLNSEKIYSILKKQNKKLKLLLHPEVINLDIKFENKFNVEILSSNEVRYAKELSNCYGLITDYSSLFFDVLYQEKVVIHHQPYELHHENKSLQTFYQSIEKTDSILELEQIVTKVTSNDWELTTIQKDNLENIYSFRDFNNCERICKKIEIMKKDL